MKPSYFNFITRILIMLAMPAALFASCEPDENTDDAQSFEWPEVLANTETKQITYGQASWDFHSRWSNDGTKIGFARYNPNTRLLSYIIYNTESGEETEIMSQSTSGDFCGSWSPDDKRIVFDNRDEDERSQIYIIDVETKEITKFTNTRTNSFRPSWSKDGKYIVYSEYGPLYYKPVAGGNAVMISGVTNGWNPCWSSDDSKIMFVKASSNDEIYSTNLDGSDIRFLASGNSGENENWGSWSPDGKKIMYHLFHDGVSKIAVKDLESEEINLISDLSDCRFPDWSPDGTKAVFSYQNRLWIVEMK